LLKPARDSKGRLVGAKALGPYGTPKCEFITQLLRVAEPENAALGGCWIGAHPSLGERIANALFERGLIAGLPPALGLRREVANIAGCDMRADFLLTHEGDARTVVEVKTVVDTDYNPATAPDRKDCVFLGRDDPYVRAGIFPWGRAAQQGPQGEQVVSARAIKHVDELAAIARGKRREKGCSLAAAVLFIVVRHDARKFRPNHEACKSFAQHLAAAASSGVRVLAQGVRWGEGPDKGKAFSTGPLEVEWPKAVAVTSSSGRAGQTRKSGSVGMMERGAKRTRVGSPKGIRAKP